MAESWLWLHTTAEVCILYVVSSILYTANITIQRSETKDWRGNI